MPEVIASARIPTYGFGEMIFIKLCVLKILKIGCEISRQSNKVN
jgi:hypothetical protein